MQTPGGRLSLLRRQLLWLKDVPRQELLEFLEDSPLVRGTLYTLRRKCAKPSCRCARGRRHESLVLTATVSGKTRLWTISADRADEIRRRTQDYRRFRKARARFLKRYAERGAELLRAIDAIEKARTVTP